MRAGYRIFGIVQGVGFRPYVARTAEKYGICGYVKNCGGYVELLAEGGHLRSFLHDLFAFSGIISYEEFTPSGESFEDFKIVESTDGDALPPLLTPDLPLCDECETELFDTSSRRYLHPFISCAKCGARYSITEKIPYDRERTTMAEFPLCDDCKKEYGDISNRRHFAQTQCCNECGPEIYFNNLTGVTAIEKAIEEITSGKVIAIKGVGGYHLAADPSNDAAISRLREIKRRDKKPFAVMMRDMETIRKYCHITDAEEKTLKSNARPIVLLKPKKSCISPFVAQESDRLGVFLPYTGYQHLILQKIEAIVLTSANLSDNPIIIEDEDAKKIPCDGVLHHNREIVTPLDDSVIAIVDDEPVIFRRARGYVPLTIRADAEDGIFAAGSDLKASFGFSKGGNLYLSQYLGDLENSGNAKRYESEIKRMGDLFEVRPKRVVCDLHPGFHSSKIAEEMGLPTVKIQHHFAHTLAVMAEFSLDSAIGISFDGTGYGTDGAIWGSEFIYADRYGFKRIGHLKEWEMLGGDDFAKDAKKCAISLLLPYGNVLSDSRFDIIRAALHNKINTVRTTSAGRLFDGVAAMLGICEENTYEGRCGEALCRVAESDCDAADIRLPLEILEDEFEIDPTPFFERVIKNEEKKSFARAFHISLANAIVDGAVFVREKTSENNVCLSGGVFQNRLLLSLAKEGLKRAGFNVYHNKKYPLGDGSIALGQLYFKERK
ncbi:MAG: carbamoyltransferase HypF [Clostridia bacterium]|nr:carbamoyltransferase HypF [Clostridia bacterium]